MATKHGDISGYCDSLYTELNDIKNKLIGFKGRIEGMTGKERDVLASHIKHIDELIESVEWKMEIFSKSCPVDWSKFGKEAESTVSVPSSEGKDMPAGGYAGG